MIKSDEAGEQTIPQDDSYADDEYMDATVEDDLTQ